MYFSSAVSASPFVHPQGSRNASILDCKEGRKKAKVIGLDMFKDLPMPYGCSHQNKPICCRCSNDSGH